MAVTMASRLVRARVNRMTSSSSSRGTFTFVLMIPLSLNLEGQETAGSIGIVPVL
jgi:hypothetical protein